MKGGHNKKCCGIGKLLFQLLVENGHVFCHFITYRISLLSLYTQTYGKENSIKYNAWFHSGI